MNNNNTFIEKDLQLIKTLRLAYEWIRDANDWKWTNTYSCNCGVVARGLLGITENELFEIDFREMKENITQNKGVWRWAKWQICPQTGLPFSKIFLALHNAGLDKPEISKLELCGRRSMDFGDILKSDVLTDILLWRSELITEVKRKLNKMNRSIEAEEYLTALLAEQVPLLHHGRGVEA